MSPQDAAQPNRFGVGRYKMLNGDVASVFQVVKDSAWTLVGYAEGKTGVCYWHADGTVGPDDPFNLVAPIGDSDVPADEDEAPDVPRAIELVHQDTGYGMDDILAGVQFLKRFRCESGLDVIGAIEALRLSADFLQLLKRKGIAVDFEQSALSEDD